LALSNCVADVPLKKIAFLFAEEGDPYLCDDYTRQPILHTGG